MAPNQATNFIYIFEMNRLLLSTNGYLVIAKQIVQSLNGVMLLFGMSHICLQIFQLIGISHTHFLSYNPLQASYRQAILEIVQACSNSQGPYMDRSSQRQNRPVLIRRTSYRCANSEIVQACTNLQDLIYGGLTIIKRSCFVLTAPFCQLDTSFNCPAAIAIFLEQMACI